MISHAGWGSVLKNVLSNYDIDIVLCQNVFSMDAEPLMLDFYVHQLSGRPYFSSPYQRRLQTDVPSASSYDLSVFEMSCVE